MSGALPVGTRVLHIGPHKTGTTTLQNAFHLNRDRLATHGIHYVGESQQHAAAALEATRLGARSGTRASLDAWRGLVAEVDNSTADRVVISSEFFADARPAPATRIVDALDRDRVHVVITLRPLAKILPSQWQQYVQNRLTVSYDDWLDAMFNHPPYARPTPSFWRRHRHDKLVSRWVKAAGGPSKVTVVVVDDKNRQSILRAFETLLGAPVGTLQPEAEGINRSLTAAEARVLLAFNKLFVDSSLPDSFYQSAVRWGAARRLTRTVPQAGDTAITTPAWALERVQAMAATTIHAIAASGVGVVGDLSLLAATTPPRMDDEPADLPVSPSVAAQTVLALALAVAGPEASPPLDALTSRELAAAIARRGFGRVGSVMRRPRR